MRLSYAWAHATNMSCPLYIQRRFLSILVFVALCLLHINVSQASEKFLFLKSLYDTKENNENGEEERIGHIFVGLKPQNLYTNLRFLFIFCFRYAKHFEFVMNNKVLD